MYLIYLWWRNKKWKISMIYLEHYKHNYIFSELSDLATNNSMPWLYEWVFIYFRTYQTIETLHWPTYQINVFELFDWEFLMK